MPALPLQKLAPLLSLKCVSCGVLQDSSNAQSIQDASRHADEFRKAAQTSSGAESAARSLSSPRNQQPPPGLPQLDMDLLGSLSLRLQDVVINRGFDQDVIIVLGRVCSGLSQLAQHSQVYQNQLMTTPFLLEGVTAMLSSHSPEASAHAALLLSQMALASPESAERLILQPSFMDALSSMIGGSYEVGVDTAALLANNCAGMGGVEVIGPMTQHAALMEVLVEKLGSGSPLQLQRIVSTMNHLSRSSVSAKQLRERRVPQILVRLTTRREESTTASAYKGLATMALANMVQKLNPASSTLNPTIYTLHFIFCILHPTPYILHLSPYTLHPTPYTLHPTPYTLHHTP